MDFLLRSLMMQPYRLSCQPSDRHKPLQRTLTAQTAGNTPDWINCRRSHRELVVTATDEWHVVTGLLEEARDAAVLSGELTLQLSFKL